MFRLNMFSQSAFLCSFIITLFTRILDTFMFRLNMSLKDDVVCSALLNSLLSISSQHSVSARSVAQCVLTLLWNPIQPVRSVTVLSNHEGSGPGALHHRPGGAGEAGGGGSGQGWVTGPLPGDNPHPADHPRARETHPPS